MRVEVTQLVEACPLDEAGTARIVAAALSLGGREGLCVGVVFAADELMVELHGEYLDDPTPTDVITFDLGEPEAPGGPTDVVTAELYVGVEEAARVAALRGVAWERELALYVVHGVLHLCGFDDHDDADSAAMRAAEAAVMETLGYPPDVLPHHS